MKKKFSLFNELSKNLQTIEDIDCCIKISLGPIGKVGMLCTKKKEIKILSTGSSLIKSLDFKTYAATLLLRLLEQASIKTQKISGDGSATTVLFTCQLLKGSIKFLALGYNSVQMSNGLKQIASFLIERTWELSTPIFNLNQLKGVLKTIMGKKFNADLEAAIFQVADQIKRDSMVLIEENAADKSQTATVQGIELDRGFASPYFINDLKQFEVVYENPKLLITNTSIVSINQIEKIIEHIKNMNRSLVIIAESINKEVVSSLILNTIKKKLKVVVIKFGSIDFIKTGILEDLSLLTHSNYLSLAAKNANKIFTIRDLGQVEKAIIRKDKSTFIISKFIGIIAKRRINELNRELLMCETDYEKNLFKTRIARLSSNIIKIKIRNSNTYQMEEERKKIESIVLTLRCSLEEGIVPGGGITYLYLREELHRWGSINLIGEETFSMIIVAQALTRPFNQLFNNVNSSKHSAFQKFSSLGYPYGYNLLEKKVVHTIADGLVDTTKSTRLALWNSLTLTSAIITNE